MPTIASIASHEDLALNLNFKSGRLKVPTAIGTAFTETAIKIAQSVRYQPLQSCLPFPHHDNVQRWHLVGAVPVLLDPKSQQKKQRNGMELLPMRFRASYPFEPYPSRRGTLGCRSAAAPVHQCDVSCWNEE
jgi:hypothetical protein